MSQSELRLALDGFGQVDAVEFDRVRVVALGLHVRVPVAEHPIELVDDQVDGLVAVLGLGGGIDVGSVDSDVRFGDKFMIHVVLGVAFEFDPDAQDALVVAK